MKKKLTGIFLLLCFTAPFGMSFLFLQHQKYRIRQEVEEQILAGMDREELVLLKFSEEECRTMLDWEDGREFGFRGQMYDIVETEHAGDSFYFWCWRDREEARLNDQLDKLLEDAFSDDPGIMGNRERVASFYISLYFQPLTKPALFTVQAGQIQNPGERNYHDICFPPPVPPPEFC